MTNSTSDQHFEGDGPTYNLDNDEVRLRAWLEGVPLVDEDTNGLAEAVAKDVPEWLLPEGRRLSTVPALADVEPISEQPVAEETEEPKRDQLENWQDAWRPTDEEAALPVLPETERIVDVGLHALTNERRIILLKIIGEDPTGADGSTVRSRYAALLQGSKMPRDNIR
ncbi:MAG TPA: hypothetical protein VJJ78_00655 [Candidatus Saccharimonadales bacterium]|nr:hypothetical protein [Candidatus Saccharimonadales bacterium]